MSLRSLKRRLMRRIGLIPPKYKSFVSNAGDYDTLGRSQFDVLRFFGLKHDSYLLDIGCGSLNCGRFAIPMLAAGHYYGIEPERWLVEEGIRHELGNALYRSKRPVFDHDRNFKLNVFGRRFDFLIAHSIISHTPQAQIRVLLDAANEVMATDALFLATYGRGESDYAGDEWVYPGGVRYTPDRIHAIAADAGLECADVRWPHPRQSWVVFYRLGRAAFVEERTRAAAVVDF
jgi:cyclopropane fatty-acyl-phospholipid synthase-like methyltransferase